jgi:hypothetical protein
MKSIAALVMLLFVGSAQVEEMPQPEPKLEQHEWLQQLVGEWTVTAEATMAPGAEPMGMESTERTRSIGGLWVMSEMTASLAGTPFTSIMTLGYDPKKKAFVGTWIDSMQTHMWHYVGTLDETKTVLTLATEGPSMDDPDKECKFRDTIELKGKDVRLLTSSVQGEDGTWSTFMRAEYQRKK